VQQRLGFWRGACVFAHAMGTAFVEQGIGHEPQAQVCPLPPLPPPPPLPPFPTWRWPVCRLLAACAHPAWPVAG
jgi:hypothetical protein